MEQIFSLIQFQNETMAAHNSTFAIGGVSCSADSLVVAESFLLRINICGKKTRPSQIYKTLNYWTMPLYKQLNLK